MLMLKNEILDPILLRRTKDTRYVRLCLGHGRRWMCDENLMACWDTLGHCSAEDIMLPPRLVRLRQDRMDEKEDDFYQVRPLSLDHANTEGSKA